MGSVPPWRFDADFLSLEERFGYSRVIWPQARAAMKLRPGMRVLDVGCGAGSLTRFLAGALDGHGEIVGLDADEALLARAREGLSPTKNLQVRFERGDALALPFPDAHFDAVVSAFLVCVLPDPLLALREMRRVTKPGGLVASLSCFCKSGILPVFGGLHEFPDVERYSELRRRFVDIRRTTVRNPALGLPNGQDLDVWGDYARAGLVDLTIDGFLTMFAPSDARWSDADAREFVEGRARIEEKVIANMTAEQFATLEAHGFPRKDAEELLALTRAKYAWLLGDSARIRRGMEVIADPAVLIIGRAP